MVFSPQTLPFNLLKKYDTAVPRYTSYPPATELTDQFNATDFRSSILASNERKTPLSLYFHIPFCQSACYFCGCNVVVSNNKNIALPYLEYLHKDIRQTSALVDHERRVKQIHWGGGTPNYLSLEQIESLWKTIHQNFVLDENPEISIEVNPRYIDRNYILFLREMGFNRISFGIQDFNPQVQEAVNRVQPEELLFSVMDWIREAGFSSVNVDLIYGLPYQTFHSFRETIQKTIKLNPDRIAVFNFAYVPWMKAVQKNIDPETLPPAEEKLEILRMTIEELTENGYLYIGMDHFAKPNDELAIAQHNRTLKRNFQGYTTIGNAELLGFGATSISMLEDTYAQNHKHLRDYYQAIDAGILPVQKGFKLNRADILRRDIIMQLMSNFQLIKSEIEQQYHLDFDTYFDLELEELEPLAADGLVELSSEAIRITDIGRLLVRNIAFVFDTYTPHQLQQKLSRAI